MDDENSMIKLGIIPSTYNLDNLDNKDVPSEFDKLDAKIDYSSGSENCYAGETNPPTKLGKFTSNIPNYVDEDVEPGLNLANDRSKRKTFTNKPSNVKPNNVPKEWYEPGTFDKQVSMYHMHNVQRKYRSPPKRKTKRENVIISVKICGICLLICLILLLSFAGKTYYSSQVERGTFKCKNTNALCDVEGCLTNANIQCTDNIECLYTAVRICNSKPICKEAFDYCTIENNWKEKHELTYREKLRSILINRKMYSDPEKKLFGVDSPENISSILYVMSFLLLFISCISYKCIKCCNNPFSL